MARPGRRILGDRDVEALLEKFAHVGFDTQVGGHPGQNHLADAALAKLQNEVVVLRSVDLVGLATTVSPSSIKGLYRSSQSAPEP